MNSEEINKLAEKLYRRIAFSSVDKTGYERDIDDELKLLQWVKEQQEEIERLNNIINEIKSQLDYLETYSSKEDVFEDMKKRLDRIESIVNRKW